MRVMMTRSIRTMLFAFAVLIMSIAASAQVRITVGFGPPAIPVYELPVCPGDGYLWTPGYWAWDSDFDDYYWVPGTWIEAPEVGFLWTPPWWGWDGGVFLFHEGWWGPHIGFYGGINYGFGYFGDGFVGGRWQEGHFFYNRDVLNVNVVNIHNVYNEHVTIVNNTHVSFNGGEGGLTARPRPEEVAAEHDRHIAPVAAQNEHIQQARGNPQLRASANQGRPPIAATARAGDFHSAVPASEAGGAYHPPVNRGAEARPANAAPGESRAAVHPNDLPPAEHPAAPNTGNPKLDQKYQKQQQKLADQQNKERQNLQAQQEKEHQQLAQRNASDAEKQQLEQKHAQQTQQMQQRHQTQRQTMQSHQTPHGK
jgi:WXXGXW repeat (2 copies)